ncbi:hypothetical protein S40285_04400 [Stachybotrys chlorohalonatus IBT 40285]|uniref:Zn(2)-C6 fungal-type domain-containing protein n=1 Tax=Stachybotrys chlorohalonatus (strain IBT 40285) TaxID=1283841 RepID=A0A084R1U1_STAC4|nr:hypothetical protein S40285_04400 [Stachybotrys chlorohalonata IBT 40285]
MHLTGKIDNRDDGKRNSPGSTRFSNTSKKGLEKRKVSVPKHCFLEGCPDFLMFKYEQACDHCHVRRIRCDAAKPQCSHCVLYDKVCVYTPFIKKRQAQLRANRTAGERCKPKDSKKANTARNSTPSHPCPMQNQKSKKDGQDIMSAATGGPSHFLPPLADLLPIVEDYFAALNPIIPLFNNDSFLQMILQWHGKRDESDWIAEATVTTVLALSLRFWATKRILSNGLGVDDLIEHALSFVGKLIRHDQGIQGTRLLLGLIMLCQHTESSEMVLMLIAMAVQSAHNLRIHEKPGAWDGEDAQDKVQLFYIMYILDKDIHVGMQVPYLHQDLDTSLDLDGASHHVGLMVDSNSSVAFNFLTARFHLARIQGRIYDWMFSSVTRDAAYSEKQPQAERLHQVLEGWRLSIPAEFRYENLPIGVPWCAQRQLMCLHAAYFKCLWAINGVYLQKAEWVRRITAWVGCGVAGDPAATNKKIGRARNTNWSCLVGYSRKCMMMFRAADHDDKALIWSFVYPYFGAMIMLMVNKLTLQEPEEVAAAENDETLVHEGLRCMKWVSQDGNRPHVAMLYDACTELNRLVSTWSSQFLGGPSPPDTEPYKGCPVTDVLDAFKEIQAKPSAVA